MKRKIIRIDEEKCDGCGQCASACAEGAIRIIDGKARLVSETYCDGLGACIGECPRGAIWIEEREAAAFDPKAVEEHLKRSRAQPETRPHAAANYSHPAAAASHPPVAHGCPGDMSRHFAPACACPSDTGRLAAAEDIPSVLRNWPLQLHLVPVSGPQYHDAALLVSADCVPFSMADFHKRLLDGRALLIGCPKLDDTAAYLEKLEEILRRNEIRSLDVAYMEVPCCFGLVHLVRTAIGNSRKAVPIRLVKVGIRGGIMDVQEG